MKKLFYFLFLVLFMSCQEEPFVIIDEPDSQQLTDLRSERNPNPCLRIYYDNERDWWFAQNPGLDTNYYQFTLIRRTSAGGDPIAYYHLNNGNYPIPLQYDLCNAYITYLVIDKEIYTYAEAIDFAIWAIYNPGIPIERPGITSCIINGPCDEMELEPDGN